MLSSCVSDPPQVCLLLQGGKNQLSLEAELGGVFQKVPFELCCAGRASGIKE